MVLVALTEFEAAAAVAAHAASGSADVDVLGLLVLADLDRDLARAPSEIDTLRRRRKGRGKGASDLELVLAARTAATSQRFSESLPSPRPAALKLEGLLAMGKPPPVRSLALQVLAMVLKRVAAAAALVLLFVCTRLRAAEADRNSTSGVEVAAPAGGRG